MQPELIVRNIELSDVDSVFQLGQSIFTWPAESALWNDEAILWYCNNSRTFSFVAEFHGALIGFVLCSVAHSTGCVQWIAVDEQFRGQGVALRLLHRAQLVFFSLGIGRICSLVREDGRADSLFKHLGFRDGGYRKIEMYLELGSTATSLYSNQSSSHS